MEWEAKIIDQLSREQIKTLQFWCQAPAPEPKICMLAAADQSSRQKINIITLSQDNSEGLDDLQFNLGKIQVISKSITMALKFRPKGQFMLFAGTDKYCWRDCRECQKSREQVGRNLVEKVKFDISAIFTF